MSRTEPEWFKSSYSGSEGDNCIEVAVTQSVHVRDSKQPEYGQLTLSTAAWSAVVSFAVTAESEAAT